MKQKLVKFIEFTQSRCIKPNRKNSKGKFPNLWTDDDWHLEVSKCLLVGIDTYRIYNPPARFWDNPYYDKEKLIEDSTVKLNTIESLNKVKDSADNLFICEVGRGLDILVASTVKNWSEIICYDYYDYEPLLQSFFASESITFILSDSEVFDFSKIDKKVILIANCINSISLDKITNYKNDNIVHIIWNGELVSL